MVSGWTKVRVRKQWQQRAGPAPNPLLCSALRPLPPRQKPRPPACPPGPRGPHSARPLTLAPRSPAARPRLWRAAHARGARRRGARPGRVPRRARARDVHARAQRDAQPAGGRGLCGQRGLPAGWFCAPPPVAVAVFALAQVLSRASAHVTLCFEIRFSRCTGRRHTLQQATGANIACSPLLQPPQAREMYRAIVQGTAPRDGGSSDPFSRNTCSAVRCVRPGGQLGGRP